jgi:SAM-dependent methyltransferase
MNNNLEELRDPDSGRVLIKNEIELLNEDGKRYQIINNIPRFISNENYSADFGKQWQIFPGTQLDSVSGLNITEERIKRCLNGDLNKIKNKRVLEAGSGAGRFSEILLKYDAILHSFDISNAVEVNAENNKRNENFILVQADIRKIPFSKESYDYVICLGVLQHTPSPEQSIECLWKMVKPGGFLVLDHYPWKWRIILPTPIGEALSIYRFIILKIPKLFRFKFVKNLVDFWFPVHWKYKDSKIIQRILRRISPVIFHYPDIDLKTKDRYYEWALLDTHDGTTDYFKHRRTVKQIKNFLEKIGAKEIKIGKGGNGIEVFCQKPIK